jgi:iron complex outermembrane receptor protein
MMAPHKARWMNGRASFGLRPKKLAHSVAAVVLAALAQAAMPAQELIDLSLEQLLDVQIYSASKFYEKASDAPSWVTVVTSEDIRQYGWRTLAEVLRAVPGFYVTYDRIYEVPGVRGFNRLGDFGSRLLVLIDGYRTNDVIYDSGFIGTEMLLDMDLVERIEIVRGPGSSIYGSNALFGVVNMVTRSAAAVTGAELAGSWASYQTGYGRATFGKQLENGAGLLLSASAVRSGGADVCDINFATGNKPDGCTSGTDYDYNRRFFGKFSYGGFVLTAAANRRDKGIPLPYGGAVFDDPDGKQNDSQAFVNAEYRHNFSSQTELTGRLFWGNYEGEADLNFADAEDVPVMNVDSADGKWWGTELKLVSQLSARNKLVAGVEYVDAYRQTQYQYDKDPFFVYLDSKPSSTRLGIYAQDEFQWTDSLKLVAGARWDKYSDLDAQFNPRLALVWKPAEQTVAKLMYGSAFRAANVYEQFYVLEGNSIANPSLQPEQINTWEAVLEHYLSRSTRLQGAAYYYKVNDLINQVAVPVSDADGNPVLDDAGNPVTLLQFQNVAGASSFGLDLVAEHRWDNGARLRAAVDYQTSEDSEGNELTNSPQWMIKVLGSLPLPWWGLQAGAEALWMSSRKTELGASVPSYGTINLTLWKPRLKSNWEFSASVFNLFDEKYADPVLFDPLFPDRDRIVQDGRTFRVKAILYF